VFAAFLVARNQPNSERLQAGYPRLGQQMIGASMQLSFDIDGLPPEAGALGGWRGPTETKIWLPEQDSNLRPFD
jgi:hypothetical protein